MRGYSDIRLIAGGYDPARGMLHSSIDPDRHSFVFDMMEPLRPVVDRAVLKFVSEETFSGADFILQQNGVCRLSPERRGVLFTGLIYYDRGWQTWTSAVLPLVINSNVYLNRVSPTKISKVSFECGSTTCLSDGSFWF